MIYAVIADIHGNFPAFKAVVQAAQAQGAEGFLLLGDYIRDTPTLNEVIALMRSLPACTAILGNGDLGVLALDETKPKICSYDQMQPNFWTYHNLTKANLAFLQSLEETADLSLENSQTIHLSHSIPLIHHKPRLGIFHSGDYGRLQERAAFSLAEGRARMQTAAQAYAHEIRDYPGDICLYGHNHLQFLGQVAGKTLLNPGSCGMPADYDKRAPFALIKAEEDEVKIQLERVEYDVAATIQAVLDFKGFPYADFWGRLRAAILQTGSDIPMSRFWQHAQKIGSGAFPLSNQLWHEAVTSFEFDHNWQLADWQELGRRMGRMS